MSGHHADRRSARARARRIAELAKCATLVRQRRCGARHSRADAGRLRLTGAAFWCWAVALSATPVGAETPPQDCPWVPPSWESRLTYYNSFDSPDGSAEVNVAGLTEKAKPATGPGGIVGRCARSEGRQGLALSGAALSPHRPLAVSFWWALLEEAKLDSGFSLLHLSGSKGFVSHFARSGPWCGLERPAAVLQVYYLPGIANVNGIYDWDLLGHLNLQPGVWHHTALVFSAASLVELYTDGRKVWEVRLTGRNFAESDGLSELVLGGLHGGLRVALDEVMILDRPLTAAEIGDYCAVMGQLGEVWCLPR